MNAPITRAEQTALSVTLTMDDEVRRELQRGEGALVEAQAYTIDSAADAQLVAEEMNGYKKAIVKLEDLRKGFLRPAQEIIDNAKALFNPAIDSLKGAESRCKGLLADWNQKEARRIAEENARREAEARAARQKAEQEAAAARAKAEADARAKREEAARQEEARRKAEAEGNAKAAREAAERRAKLEEQARAAEENGAAKAEQAHIQAAAQATAVAPEAATKIQGVQMRDNWVGRLKPGYTTEQAKAEIVAACAARPELLGLVEIDESAINKMAKALKGAMHVPGYEARNEPVVAGRRS